MLYKVLTLRLTQELAGSTDIVICVKRVHFLYYTLHISTLFWLKDFEFEFKSLIFFSLIANTVGLF